MTSFNVHQKSKLTVCQNPKCNNIIHISNGIFILNVELGGIKRKYFYCCRRHLEEMLENLNKNTPIFDMRVYIISQKIISERNPFEMSVVLKEENLNYTLILGGK